MHNGNAGPFTFLLLVVLVFIALGFWLGVRRRQAQTGFQHKLLDKFSSLQEIGEFIQTGVAGVSCRD